MGRITLFGFYQYDNSIFDGIVLPDGMDRNALINEILKNSGDLFPYHQQPDMLKLNIAFWFSRKSYDFFQMYRALRAEYNPIENYDRIENISRKSQNSGTDKAVTTLGSSRENKHTGAQTATQSGTVENEKGVSAYNESGYSNREKDTQRYNNVQNAQSENDTTTVKTSGSDMTETQHGLKREETEENRIHGNIGVTTSQKMITEEIEMRSRFDIYKVIAQQFEHEFLIQVY